MALHTRLSEHPPVQCKGPAVRNLGSWGQHALGECMQGGARCPLNSCGDELTGGCFTSVFVLADVWSFRYCLLPCRTSAVSTPRPHSGPWEFFYYQPLDQTQNTHLEPGILPSVTFAERKGCLLIIVCILALPNLLLSEFFWSDFPP